MLAIGLSDVDGGTCHNDDAEGRLLSEVMTDGGVAQNAFEEDDDAGVRSIKGASSLGVSGSTS